MTSGLHIREAENPRKAQSVLRAQPASLVTLEG